MFACHHGLSLGLASALLRGDLMTTRLCLLLVSFSAHSLCTRSFFVGSCTRVLSSSLAMLGLLAKLPGFLTPPLQASLASRPSTHHDVRRKGELGPRGLRQRQRNERPMNVLLPTAVTAVVFSLK
jgi:hypothetical protein